MNIENVKLKKLTLITLFMFAVMVMLPGFISSLATKVNAYKFYSISGYEWNTDEGVAELYEFLYNKTKDDQGELPVYGEKMTNKNFRIGTELGASSLSESSFNRAGCLRDIASHSCNMVCYHPGNSTFDYDKDQKIQQILYITPDKVTFYQLGESESRKT